jgi:hypothetical protein
MNSRRIAFALGTAAAGFLAAAFLPMAVAVADDEYDFTPNGIYDVTQVEGYPPLVNEITGQEFWNFFDVTKNATVQGGQELILGTDTQTTIGSFTNDDYLTSGVQLFGSFDVSAGTQIDLANFGGGFENEWINIPTGADAGTSDLLITPFGDFQILGTAFSDIATLATGSI